MFMYTEQDYLISALDLKQLTQIDTDNLAPTSICRDRRSRSLFIDKRASKLAQSLRPGLLIFCSLIFMVLFGWFITRDFTVDPTSSKDWMLFYLDSTIRSIIFTTIFFCCFDIFLIFLYKRQIQDLMVDPKLKTLRDLLDEIAKYNEVVKNLFANLNAIDNFQEAGAKVNLNNRSEILATTIYMRDDLVRALKIERIFRTNSRVNPESISIDFTPNKALQTIERANQYGKELNQLLDISLAVQKEIKSLDRYCSKP
ncbi:MAG: hypothetical protein ACFBSE_12915 [Prochloraceae cyanobacterium]